MKIFNYNYKHLGVPYGMKILHGINYTVSDTLPGTYEVWGYPYSSTIWHKNNLQFASKSFRFKVDSFNFVKPSFMLNVMSNFHAVYRF